MTREELIKKWLDNELNPSEYKAFKALEDVDDLEKLAYNSRRFEAPDVDLLASFKEIKAEISSKKSIRKISWTTHFIRVAAAVIIGLGIFYYTSTLDTNVSALMAEKSSVVLPDDSEVMLNAMSSVSFNKHKWDDSREITLEGEAYFKVAKGESFNVRTYSGTVTVLGTEFNVKQRDNLFEVVCYEGSVKVTHQLKTDILKPGDSFLILDGKYIAKEKENTLNPSWIDNKSYFKSMPYSYVINEFERQYGVQIDSKNIDTTQLFTGSFVHNDQTLALKSLTLPLNLTYRQTSDKTIVLARE